MGEILLSPLREFPGFCLGVCTMLVSDMSDAKILYLIGVVLFVSLLLILFTSTCVVGRLVWKCAGLQSFQRA